MGSERLSSGIQDMPERESIILDSRDPRRIILNVEYKGKYLAIIDNDPATACWVEW